MTSIKLILLFLIVTVTLNVSAQKAVINILDSGRKASLRGLSVVDNNVVWASGSNGTVARSTNGGKSFEWLTVQGYEQRDFRDIEAFDANTALIMAVAEPAIILKTDDGGKTWKKVFEDTTKGMFLDAIDFADNKNGVVAGDPLSKYFFFAFSNDGGNTWHISEDTSRLSKAFPNEAFFAASGTNIKFIKSNNKLVRFYVTGGGKSRIFSDQFGISNLDIVSGKESQGANSICIKNNNIVVVGGDFANDSSTLNNCVLISFKGNTSNYSYPDTPPHGYRSCVEYITKDKLITCGTSGVDISNDGGMNWELISTKGFHVCHKAKKGSKVFLAGANGKIAQLLYK